MSLDDSDNNTNYENDTNHDENDTNHENKNLYVPETKLTELGIYPSARFTPNMKIIWQGDKYSTYNTCFLPQIDYWKTYLSSKLTKKDKDGHFIYETSSRWDIRAVRHIFQLYISRCNISTSKFEIDHDNFMGIYVIADETQDEELLNEIEIFLKEKIVCHARDNYVFRFQSTFTRKLFNINGIVRDLSANIGFIGKKESDFSQMIIGNCEENFGLTKEYLLGNLSFPHTGKGLINPRLGSVYLNNYALTSDKEKIIRDFYNFIDTYIDKLKINLDNTIGFLFIISKSKIPLPNTFTKEKLVSFMQKIYDTFKINETLIENETHISPREIVTNYIGVVNISKALKMYMPYYADKTDQFNDTDQFNEID